MVHAALFLLRSGNRCGYAASFEPSVGGRKVSSVITPELLPAQRSPSVGDQMPTLSTSSSSVTGESRRRTCPPPLEIARRGRGSTIHDRADLTRKRCAIAISQSGTTVKGSKGAISRSRCGRSHHVPALTRSTCNEGPNIYWCTADPAGSPERATAFWRRSPKTA